MGKTNGQDLKPRLAAARKRVTELEAELAQQRDPAREAVEAHAREMEAIATVAVTRLAGAHDAIDEALAEAEALGEKAAALGKRLKTEVASARSRVAAAKQATTAPERKALRALEEVAMQVRARAERQTAEIAALHEKLSTAERERQVLASRSGRLVAALNAGAAPEWLKRAAREWQAGALMTSPDALLVRALRWALTTQQTANGEDPFELGARRAFGRAVEVITEAKAAGASLDEVLAELTGTRPAAEAPVETGLVIDDESKAEPAQVAA